MKKSESRLESTSKLRKFTKTPSTTYSLSMSPDPAKNTNKGLSLLVSLDNMQTQLANNLQKYSEYLEIKIPNLCYRYELVKIRQDKLHKYIKTLKNILNSINETQKLRELEINVEEKEKNIEKFKIEASLIKKKIKEMRNKCRELETYRKKEEILDKNINIYKEELEKIKGSKEILIDNKKKITKYRKKLLEMYEPIKINLEEVMINKEELMLSLPQVDVSYEKLGKIGEELQERLIENKELEDNTNSLTLFYKEIIERIKEKNSDLIIQKEKFEAKLALIRLQERFVEEKKIKIELFSNELNSINFALDNAICIPNENNRNIKNKSKSQIRLYKPSNSKIPYNKSFYK